MEHLMKKLPNDLQNLLLRSILEPRNQKLLKSFELLTIRRSGLDSVAGPTSKCAFPFLTFSKIGPANKFRKEALCYLWYLLDLYTIPFAIYLPSILDTIHSSSIYSKQFRYIRKFLEWFGTIEDWDNEMSTYIDLQPNYKWVVLLLHRQFYAPHSIISPFKIKKWLWFYDYFTTMLGDEPPTDTVFTNLMFELNANTLSSKEPPSNTDDDIYATAMEIAAYDRMSIDRYFWGPRGSSVEGSDNSDNEDAYRYYECGSTWNFED